MSTPDDQPNLDAEIEHVEIFYPAGYTVAKIETLASEFSRYVSELSSKRVQVKTSISQSNGVTKRDFDKASQKDVVGTYNSPSAPSRCALTVSLELFYVTLKRPDPYCGAIYPGRDDDISGYCRGSGEVCIKDTSIHTVIHEWLHHYAWKKWKINPDTDRDFDYPDAYGENRTRGENEKWKNWYVTLLGKEEPKRRTP